MSHVSKDDIRALRFKLAKRFTLATCVLFSYFIRDIRSGFDSYAVIYDKIWMLLLRLGCFHLSFSDFGHWTHFKVSSSLASHFVDFMECTSTVNFLNLFANKLYIYFSNKTIDL